MATRISSSNPTLPAGQQGAAGGVVKKAVGLATKAAKSALSGAKTTLAGVKSGNVGEIAKAVDSFGTIAGTAAEARKLISRNTQLGRVLGVTNIAKGLKDGVKGIVGSYDQIHRALQTGNLDDVNDAIRKTADTLKGWASTTKTAVEVSKRFGDVRAALRAASKLKELSPLVRAGADVAVRSAARQAARIAAAGGTRAEVVRVAIAAAKGLKRAGGRALGREVGEAAFKAAAPRLAERAALKSAGKVAGRFVPGLNIAIAAADGATALAIQRNPRSSLAKKILGWVTAAASGLAATNIPIASQIGAGVSAVGGIARDVVR